MRRHGISGPIEPAAGTPKAFYPYHALKDTIVIAVVFAALLTFALKVPAPLDAVADPSDSTYVPRPEWYFLSLFQMLKYFPGPLEPVATMVIPGIVIGALLLLPFLARSNSRHPLKNPGVTAAFIVVLLGIGVLTSLGLRDTPPTANPNNWAPLSLAGFTYAQDQRCASCHRPGGSGNVLSETVLRKDPEWLIGHVRDPQVIAPGLREVPAGGMSQAQAQAVLAYMRRVRSGAKPPQVPADTATAAGIYARFCSNCHVIDGEGGAQGPDLSHEGSHRDAKFLKEWISDPTVIKPDSNMPAFGERLDEAQMNAIVGYLAHRK
jgi:ubiquinol-cytochrome c reductase cytochrome b subunit